jgi:hypothetical protein
MRLSGSRLICNCNFIEIDTSPSCGSSGWWSLSPSLSKVICPSSWEQWIALATDLSMLLNELCFKCASVRHCADHTLIPIWRPMAGTKMVFLSITGHTQIKDVESNTVLLSFILLIQFYMTTLFFPLFRHISVEATVFSLLRKDLQKTSLKWPIQLLLTLKICFLGQEESNHIWKIKFENGKMRPVETIPWMAWRAGEIKENDAGGIQCDIT